MNHQMLTKRIYFTISCIMLLVLFLFQGSSLVRQKYNRYDENIYANETAPFDAGTQFTVQTDSAAVLSDSHAFVVFIGDTDSASGTTIRQWCTYTKRNLLTYRQISDYRTYREKLPDAVLLDAAFVDCNSDLSLLTTLTSYGISIVWCSLPDFNTIENNSVLMDFLGIANAVSPSLTVSGYKLYSGFLLGGESWYIANNEGEEKYQDFSLDMPWYIPGNATKTYMAAELDSSVYGTIKTQDRPAVFWRKSLENAYIFCVNGDYLSDTGGFGILNAILYELKDYAVTPVVNAQTVSIINYPVLAFEQEDAMDASYSRNTASVLENVIWPDISTLSEYLNSRFTFLFTPQFYYQDEHEPVSQELEYFFRLLHEKQFEAGLSSTRDTDTSIREKLQKDTSVYRTFLQHYRFLSIYAKESEISEVLNGSAELTNTLQTIVTEKSSNDGNGLFAYVGNDVLQMKLLSDGTAYSYKNDFIQKSLNTALAYSSIGVDCTEICNPKEDDENVLWDKFYQKTATALAAYLPPKSVYQSCTVTQAASRIRAFLAVDYSSMRTGNTITLQIKNRSEDTFFMLRLHNEEIEDIDGADAEKIEDGAYLITPERDTVTISLKK